MIFYKVIALTAADQNSDALTSTESCCVMKCSHTKLILFVNIHIIFVYAQLGAPSISALNAIDKSHV
ncbi:hypothetical protein TU80_19590 [Pseudomonas veronii]|nr:hypothetical protein TU80_19590 [Pseudomonas veronii]